MWLFMKSITDEEAREEDASIHLQISMFINHLNIFQITR